MDRVSIFPGQGVQSPGMFKKYYDKYECVKEVFNCASKIINQDITDLIFNGTQDELNQTINTQPIILCVDLAAAAIVKHKNINIKAVAGFSIGEYAALVEAGVIDIETSFELVKMRAQAMDEAVPKKFGGMLAISKLNESEVEKIVAEGMKLKNKYAVIATYTSITQYVVSGEIDVLEKIEELAKEKGGRTAMLLVSGPFHSKFMNKAYDKLKNVFDKINFNNAKIPIYMNVDAKPHLYGDEIKELLLMQIISPVKWYQSMKNMLSDGYENYIECGYGNVLTKLMKRINENIDIINFE